MRPNTDLKTVEGFGDEWTRFDQSSLSQSELLSLFESYFQIFPWAKLPNDPIGFDLGCGSGRWAKCVAPRVAKLYCIDASAAAIAVASRNLQEQHNCELMTASVEVLPLPDNSMDFAYSLGVLHHVPDTQAGLDVCVSKLKPGAPFLVYLYYAFDNRPFWFRFLWRISDSIRRLVCQMPYTLRYRVSSIFALFVYYPLARLSYLLELCGIDVSNLPLSAYRHRSFYTMRTDALDRFATSLEQRFTKKEIEAMMQKAGLEHISFSESVYWCAIGYKKRAL